MVTSLCWDTLTRRREKQFVKVVDKCLKETAPSYLDCKYFRLRRHNIHDYDISKIKRTKLVIVKVKLQPTQERFFLKGQL